MKRGMRPKSIRMKENKYQVKMAEAVKKRKKKQVPGILKEYKWKRNRNLERKIN